MRCDFEFFERSDKPEMVLSRMFQARHIEKKAVRQSEAFRDIRPGLFSRAGMEACMVDAVVNYRNPLPWQTKEFHNVCRSVIADGDDSVLASRQTARDHAAIEHPFPIVLAGQV